MEAAVIPLPIPEITPPETNMYFVFFFVEGTIYPNKQNLMSQEEFH